MPPSFSIIQIMNRFITLIVLLSVTACVFAKKKPEYPRAAIKVGYNYHEKFMRGNVEYAEHDIPMLLLANPEQSKFYCPATEYKASLDPLLQDVPRQNRYLTSPSENT